MSNPWEGQEFLFMWIGFLLLMSCGIGAFFLWGIRSGQFANQERARYLALQAEIRDTLPRSGRDGEGEKGLPEAEQGDAGRTQSGGWPS